MVLHPETGTLSESITKEVLVPVISGKGGACSIRFKLAAKAARKFTNPGQEEEKRCKIRKGLKNM